MNFLKIVKLALVTSFCLMYFAVHAQQKAQVPKVVLIIADGIPADVIERLKPQALTSLIKSGIYSRAYVGGKTGTYKETPTISAPGYNDMLTGTWAYKHNVWENDNQHPNYNYPSIFSIFKMKRPLAKMAIFSTWLENRKTLLGEGLPQTKNLRLDYHFDGYEKDSLRFPHDTASLYLHNIDEYVVNSADSIIRKNAPDLSWIYLEYTDDIGHKSGTGTAFDQAIKLLDNQLKKIDAAIKYREANYNEKWLLIVTTDHGRDSITGADHGNQSKRERTTWMVLNHPLTNSYFSFEEPGIVDILPSVANFLKISLPSQIKNELDGTPFIGPVSITDARLNTKGDQLNLFWKSFNKTEKVKIFISYKNMARKGEPETYKLIGTTNSGTESFSTRLDNLSHHNFFKVLIQGKFNSINVWKTIERYKPETK